MKVSEITGSRLFKAFLIYLSLFLIISYLIFIFEASAGNKDFSSLLKTFWWSIVTATTVGYGDTVPLTSAGRTLASLLMIISLLFMSAVTATVASKFVEEKILEERGLKSFKDTGHIIVCGWNKFGLTLLKSIIRENLSSTPVFYLINELSHEEIDSIRYELQGTTIKFIKGNFVNEGVLHRASPSKASRILILSDTSHEGSYSKADERTILASLNLKGLAPDVPIYAELLEPENEIFLRRAQIDELIIRGKIENSILGIASISPGAARFLKEVLDPDTLYFIWEIPVPKPLISKKVKDVREWVRKENLGIFLGIVEVKEGISLEKILGESEGLIDQFIKEQFQEAEIAIGGKKDYETFISPDDEREIAKNSHLLLISSRKPQVGEEEI